MRYIVPRDQDGSPSTSLVERHDDGGAIHFVPLSEENVDAGRFRNWLAEGGAPDFASDGSAQMLSTRIAGECQRRIYAVASQNCQMNMTAWIASGQSDAHDKAAFNAALGWVQAMRARCADLIAAGEAVFADDRAWPACPAVVATLAARF